MAPKKDQIDLIDPDSSDEDFTKKAAEAIKLALDHMGVDVHCIVMALCVKLKPGMDPRSLAFTSIAIPPTTNDQEETDQANAVHSFLHVLPDGMDKWSQYQLHELFGHDAPEDDDGPPPSKDMLN